MAKKNLPTLPKSKAEQQEEKKRKITAVTAEPSTPKKAEAVEETPVWRKVAEYAKENGGGGKAATILTEMGRQGQITDSDRKQLKQYQERSARKQIDTAQKRADKAKSDYQDYLESDDYEKERVNAGVSEASSEAEYYAAIRGKGQKTQKEKELKAASDYWEQQLTRKKDAAVLRKDMEELESWPEEDRAALETYIAEREQEKYNLSGETSLRSARYNATALFNKYGAQKVKEMAESYSRLKNQETSAEAIQMAQEGAGGSVGGAIGHSAATVGANLIGGMTATAGYLGEAIDRTGRYSTMDPNNAGTIFQKYSGAVRGQVAGDIAGDGSSGVRKALSYGYQGVMSAADSIARIAVGGGNGKISLGLAALGSFGQTMSDASAQGANPTQAAILATASAGLEAATEKLPLDELLKTAKGGAKPAGNVFMSVLKQAGIEATTEEINLLGNLAAEAAILQEKSSYNQQIGDLVANGMSYQDAKAEANRAVWEEAKQTAYVSAISGGFSSGVTAVTANTAEKLSGKQEPGTGVKKADYFAGLLRGLTPVRKAEETPKTEKQMQLDAAIKKTLGIPAKGENVDTQDQKQYNNNNSINDEGEAYGQNTDDRTAGAGDPAQRMAGVRPGNGYETGGREEHGGVAQHSGVLRVSEQLRNARESRGMQSYDLYETSNSPQEYEQALLAGRNSDPVNGWCVTPKSAQELTEGNVRTVMNADRTVGLGIAADGDIVAVFKNRNGGPRKALDTAMPAAIEMGGDRLDCYGDGLVNVYESYGFIPVARVEFNPEYANEGWTPEKGTPYIYVMMHNGDSAATVTEKMYTYRHSTQAELDALPTYGKDDYDAAMAYRDGLFRKQSSGAVNEKSTLRREDGNDFEAMGAASAGFSGVTGYDELLYDGNVQPARADDAKYEEMPVQDGYGRKVSEFGANVINSEIISERDVNTVKQLVADGAFGHDVQKMDDVRQAAVEEINRRGKANVVRSITTAAANGKINEHMIAQAQLLFAHYTNRNGKQAQEMVSELLVDLSQMATQAGRQLNMFKLLRRLTPEGQLLTMQNTVDRAVQQMTDKGKLKEGTSVEIPAELQQEFLDAAKEAKEAKTPEETEAAREKQEDAANAIYAATAAQLETTFKGKWDTWRYMAMMGNLKTNVRNIMGNMAMVPYTDAKRALGAAMEKAIPKDKRTKAVMGFSQNDQDLMQWAKDDSRMYTVKNALKYSAKLGDDVTGNLMQENVKVFDSALLENFRKITEKAPAAGDMLFKRAEYAKSLAGFLKARGYSYDDIRNGNISDETLSDARDYAVSEAMKATFNDCNVFSDLMSSLRYTGNNPIGKALNILGEGVLPFRRTPANIVVRFTEYSPLGIAKGLNNLATKVRSGEMSAATAIDQLSAGLTGTGAAAIGYMLASMGILNGSGISEEEEEQGHQKYALEFIIDGKTHSYTIDWAAPANLPLFLGANMYELFQKQGDGSVSAFTNFVYSMGTMFEPMLQLSCLSSLNDLFETGKYAGEGEGLYAAASQAATSYLTQGIPALLRQADQAAHENKQQTFANSGDPLLRDGQRTAANIPFLGDMFQVDSVDEWGNAVSRGNVGQRVFDAFINPGTAKQVDTGPLETELTRLGEVQEENVRPPEVGKTISYTDTDGKRHTNKRLTAEQYTTLKTVQGKTAQSVLTGMVSGKDWQALTDDQKAKAISLAYDYAREKGRTEAIEGYPGMNESWMQNIDGKEAGAIINKVVAADISGAFASMTESWRDGNDGTEAAGDLEGAYKVYSGLSTAAKRQVLESASGRMEYYLTARSKGISTETFVDLYKTYWDIDQSGSGTSDKAQKWAYELQRARESGKITESQKDALKDSMVYYQMFPAETEKFDQMTESGISAKKALDIGKLLNGLTPKTGKTSVTAAQKAEAIAGAKLTGSEMTAVMKLYLNDTQDRNIDDMAAMGYGPEDYAAAYSIYTEEDDRGGKGTKARTINRFMQLFGVDKRTAAAIYEIYG